MSTFNDTFNGFAKRIFKALGFTDEIIASKFQSFIDGFSKEDKYKLIYETEKYVGSLEVADNELRGLTTGSLAQYMDQIKDNWESMNEQLAQLQILSLIQRKEDCSGVIKELLNILSKKIKKVAICGGAGGFLMKEAGQKGADIFITSDLKYHDYFECPAGMILADIGHFESEQFTIDLFHDVLRQNFPTFALLKTGVTTNPVRYFIAS